MEGEKAGNGDICGPSLKLLVTIIYCPSQWFHRKFSSSKRSLGWDHSFQWVFFKYLPSILGPGVIGEPMRLWETQVLHFLTWRHIEGMWGRWMLPEYFRHAESNSKLLPAKLSVMTESSLPGMSGDTALTPTGTWGSISDWYMGCGQLVSPGSRDGGHDPKLPLWIWRW